MAYYRPSAHSNYSSHAPQILRTMSASSSAINNSSQLTTVGTGSGSENFILPQLDGEIDERDHAKLRRLDEGQRPLALFGIDLTNLSPVMQYLVLVGGLILFMCLYGYYQELVIYGWFDRKLSLFSTFLHFLGCSVFAQVQRNLSFKPNSNGPNGGTHSCHIFSMGTAPTRVAIFYYALLVIVRTGGQGMSNLSMTQINYPAKVLFKSANPVVTLFIGITYLKKTYPVRDYIVVVLLVLGLYVFIAGDASESPSSTRLGIIYVVISMFGSAGVPMIQEHCMNQYNASVEDLLYHCYVGSTLLSMLASMVTGEFITGMMFLVKSGSVHTWLLMIGFCTFGYAGNNFSAAITLQYGALVNGICNTLRKAITLAASFLMFPERNVLTEQKLIGSAIFFAGLLIRIFGKAEYSPFELLQSIYSRITGRNSVSNSICVGGSSSTSPGRVGAVDPASEGLLSLSPARGRGVSKSLSGDPEIQTSEPTASASGVRGLYNSSSSIIKGGSGSNNNMNGSSSGSFSSNGKKIFVGVEEEHDLENPYSTTPYSCSCCCSSFQRKFPLSLVFRSSLLRIRSSRIVPPPFPSFPSFPSLAHALQTVRGCPISSHVPRGEFRQSYGHGDCIPT